MSRLLEAVYDMVDYVNHSIDHNTCPACPRWDELQKAALDAVVQIELLQAENAELRADAERLNYLDENQESLYTVVDVKKRPTTATEGPRYEEYREFLGWSVGRRQDECQTVREAIDAALRQRAEQEPRNGDPCKCGDTDTWHPACYASERESMKQAWIRALAAPEHTYDWDEHPEDYEGPCCCATCRSYANQDI